MGFDSTHIFVVLISSKNNVPSQRILMKFVLDMFIASLNTMKLTRKSVVTEDTVPDIQQRMDVNSRHNHPI